MEDILLRSFLGLLAVLMVCVFVRILLGPRFTDRMVGFSALTAMGIAFICVLSRLLRAAYLLDVALIYALLSFVSDVLLTRIIDKKWKEEKTP